MASPRVITSQPKLDQHQRKVLDLLFNLYLLGRKMKQAAKQHHSAHTQDQMLELGILKVVATEPQSVTQLAQLLSTGLSAMSERIKSLKDRQLIQQMATDDGREMRCELTDTGRQYMANNQTHIRETCAQLSTILTEQEIDTMKPMLQKLLTWNI